MSFEVRSPFQQFCDQSGKPIDNGRVYVGTASLNPVTNPVAIYWDEAATQPAAQPLSVFGGYIVRSGTPSRIYAATDSFSIAVYDKQGELAYSDPLVSSLSPGLHAPLVYASKDDVAALSLSSTDAGRKIFITSADGGDFTVEYSATPGTYADNGGSYCGTQFIPTGGDGTIGIVRNGGLISAAMFGGTTTLTLSVPGSYTTVQTAITFLSNWRISPETTVAIRVADGTYNLAAGINLNHPDGERIQLLGNTTTPANCIIRGPNPPTFDAVTCSNGHKFGLIDGFKIDIAAKATSANNYTGLLADNGAHITCGPHMVVDNWYYGIAARNGSSIYARSAQVSNAGDVGIWAFVGSSIDCRNAVVSGVTDAPNSLGYGIQAEYGSSVDCQGASASTCLIAGIAALSNSQVRALSATSNNNTGSGFLARDGGDIENHNATATGNTRYGEERIYNGTIHGSGITLTGNTLGAYSNYGYWDNSASNGGRIAFNGDGRIDNNGAGSIIFNTSGGAQFRVDHAASAVNNARVTGAATGGSVVFGASGADSNIGVSVQGKGTGSIFLGNNQANYARVNGATAGNAPAIYAEGSDTNIDLILSGKGTGNIRLGTYSALAAETLSGYITIKDASGALRKIGVIS